MRTRGCIFLVVLCALFLCTFQSIGKTLKIGLASEPSSTDPHFHNLGPNNALALHFFDRLIEQDEKQQLRPSLAESWESTSPTTWVFKLRKDVKWHNGHSFTAEDVIYTIKRVPQVPNSISSFSSFVKQIKEYKVIDPYTIQFETYTTFPLMAAYISSVSIICKKVAEDFVKKNPDKVKDIYTIPSKYYNSGELIIGTGPYKFVEWVQGDRVELIRNESYWGKKPVWEKVIMKPISSGSSRIASLLSGDVDIINQVPTPDIEGLKKNKNITISQGISNRVIYLHIDSHRDVSPFVTTRKGKPLKKNPLKDQRVRRAISLAINRKAISERIMQGLSIPAAQTLPDGFFGVSDKLKPHEYNPKKAKKLLKEAGYPKGFGLTIHGPNNRYVNDAKIAQAIAQFLTKIGIVTKVDAMPKNIYFTRASKYEYSLMLLGWGSDTGEPGSSMSKLLHTPNKEKGVGTSNRGRFSDTKFDKIIDEAMSTVDDAKRTELLKKAAEYGIGEQLGIIPIHFQVNTWASRKMISYKTRTDEYTLATFINEK